MKRLYIIGGTMGVGKTSVCQQLKKELPDSVFLDGDWCWDADPFQVTDETKRMVLDNICHLVNNFLHCSAYQNVIFCWVLHEQEILDEILKRLDTWACEMYCISLIADEKHVRGRLEKDISAGIRTVDVLKRSLARISLYQALDTVKIDTNGKTVLEIVDEIQRL